MFKTDGNKLDRIRPDNDARVYRVRGNLHRYQNIAGADGITYELQLSSAPRL